MERAAAKLQNVFAGNHRFTVHLLAVDKICLCTVDLQIRLWQLRTVGGTVEERRRISMVISHDRSRNYANVRPDNSRRHGSRWVGKRTN